jgi:hypothetical protein
VETFEQVTAALAEALIAAIRSSDEKEIGVGVGPTPGAAANLSPRRS